MVIRPRQGGKMEHFEPLSFLLGLASGAILMAILRLWALKSLALKLNQIGVELGIEGFSPESEASRSSASVGDISGSTVGDIAGRDIDKSTSNFHRKMRKMVQGTVRRHLEIRWTDSMRVLSQDEKFTKALEQLGSSGDNWFDQYVR